MKNIDHAHADRIDQHYIPLDDGVFEKLRRVLVVSRLHPAGPVRPQSAAPAHPRSTECWRPKYCAIAAAKRLHRSRFSGRRSAQYSASTSRSRCHALRWGQELGRLPEIDLPQQAKLRRRAAIRRGRSCATPQWWRVAGPFGKRTRERALGFTPTMQSGIASLRLTLATGRFSDDLWEESGFDGAWKGLAPTPIRRSQSCGSGIMYYSALLREAAECMR